MIEFRINSDESDRYYVVGEASFARGDLSAVFSQIIHECILDNSTTGELVNKLWQFCQARYPDEYQAALLQADKEGSYLKDAPSFFMDQFDEDSGEKLFAVLIGLLNGSADPAVSSKDDRPAKFRINSDDSDRYYVVGEASFARGDLSAVFSQMIYDCEQESADELNTFWQFCQSRYPDQYQAALLQADKEGSYLKNAPGYLTDQFDDDDGEKLITALFELLNASADAPDQSRDDRPAKFRINRGDRDHYYVIGNASFARDDLISVFEGIIVECERESADEVNKLWQLCQSRYPDQYQTALEQADDEGSNFEVIKNEAPSFFIDSFDDDDGENLITSLFELLNETDGAVDTHSNEPDFSGLDPDEAQKTRALWEKLEKLSPEEQEEFKRAILGEPEVKSESNDLLQQLVSILDANIKPSINLDDIVGGTADLSEELDEFDGRVKYLIGVDESDPPSIAAAKNTLLGVIELAKSDTQLHRGDLLIFLLEALIERLEDLLL